MSDFPGIATGTSFIGALTGGTPTGDIGSVVRYANAAAATPANNRAFYVPFVVDNKCTAYQMVWEVGAQAGNYDIGLYNHNWARLVSTGSTAVPAAGVAAVNITDTALIPGRYYMGIVFSTTTTLTVIRANHSARLLQTCGVQQEALGATTLPATATPANPASAFLPFVGVALNSVV